MPRALKSKEQQLFLKRKQLFDRFISEVEPILTDFAVRLELEAPQEIVDDPERYLDEIDLWMADQQVEENDWSWIVSRLCYFIGEVLKRRFGGCWLVHDDPDSRYFAHYMVGILVNAGEEKRLFSPAEIAARYVNTPPRRYLRKVIDDIGQQIVKP